MASMEQRVLTLEAQLLAHRLMLMLIYSEAPAAMQRMLQSAPERFSSLALPSTLPDELLETIRQELLCCAPPVEPQSPAAPS